MSDIADSIRTKRATELERLGSDRGLIALTDADLSAETVCRRIAASDLAVVTQFSMWSDSEAGEVADAFELAEQRKRTHVDQIESQLGETIEPAANDVLAGALAGSETTAQRLGAGLIGYPLVVDGRYLQGISLFVNDAEEAAADQMRQIRSETQDLQQEGESLLAETSDEQRAVAEEAALGFVDAAYAEYVSKLDALGLDPKTVC